jgi:uncharacterized membrane protein YgdD (TMEM256/DUF423 family)
MERIFLIIGALLGASGVAAGAFGAHALKTWLSSELTAAFETGVRYQLLHALALLAVAWAATRWPSTAVIAGGWCFVVGTVVFSGSLYLLALTGTRWMGAITPFGGLLFIAGWLLLAWGVRSTAPRR